MNNLDQLQHKTRRSRYCTYLPRKVFDNAQTDCLLAPVEYIRSCLGYTYLPCILENFPNVADNHSFPL